MWKPLELRSGYIRVPTCSTTIPLYTHVYTCPKARFIYRINYVFQCVHPHWVVHWSGVYNLINLTNHFCVYKNFNSTYMASLALLARPTKLYALKEGHSSQASRLHQNTQSPMYNILQFCVNINSAWLLGCRACFQSHVCWVDLHGWGWHIICGILWGISKRFALIQAFLHLPPSQPPAHDERKAHASH